jgi:16S rRNA (guanine(1405)-N(7))-methyltransferase
VRYLAYDINRPMVRLLARYFVLEGLGGGVRLCDVLCSPPAEHTEVALLLKMYHCLEHRRRGAGEAVLESTAARWVVVSFPSRNLRGRSADIAGNYLRDIERLCTRRAWEQRELRLEGETVLLVRKGEVP